jgi:hypothetical protein
VTEIGNFRERELIRHPKMIDEWTLEKVESGVCSAQKRKTAPYDKAGGGFAELTGQRDAATPFEG